MKLISVFILILGLSLSHCHVDPEIEFNYDKHIDYFIDARNPTISEGKGWLRARKYIDEQFFYHSLDIKRQKFNATVLSAEDVEMMVEGENVIGIVKGKNEGNVVVVGADYDTAQVPSSPIKNNGAGVAALIEIARIYNGMMRTVDYDPDYTVIFVAFDLNTREHSPSQGRTGSSVFVKEWLMNYLQNDTKNFRGAIILDEITNFNPDEMSQELYRGSSKFYPDAYMRITEDNKKGNFIGLYSHWSDIDDKLVDDLSAMYNRKKIALPYRLQEFKLSTKIPGDQEFTNIEGELQKTSQYSFWGNDLPAVLLSDTGVWRDDPCTSKCRPIDFIIRDRKKFMDQTSESVLLYLLRNQATHKMIDGTEGGSSSISPVIVSTLLAVIFTRFLI